MVATIGPKMANLSLKIDYGAPGPLHVSAHPILHEEIWKGLSQRAFESLLRPLKIELVARL